MLIVLSPAKSLDYETPPQVRDHTLPAFVEDSAELIEGLRKLSHAQLSQLMDISEALAVLNANRYADWSTHFTPDNSKQALLAFNGDVYEGLSAHTMGAEDLDYAQRHVRILSGLYGLLRPLDWMQPYRLEMGTRLSNARGKDLYTFWGGRITEVLNQLLVEQAEPVLVNLASEEYFKSVKPALLNARIINPVFEDWKGGADGKYKIISFYAKRARGLMARYAIDQRVGDKVGVEQLKAFNVEGYVFDGQVSTETKWVFRRKTA